MDEVKKMLKEREKQLLQMKKEKEKELKTAPEGHLRVCCHGNRTQYYYRKDPKDFSGIYMKEREHALAQKLAQKDYNRKVLSAVEKESSAIQKYFSSCPENCAEQIYETLHRERQKLILPVKETDEEYVKNWELVTYQKKEIYEETQYFTAKNERVRSKSEIIIADTLKQEGIPYRYEYPVWLNGFGTVYPDFTVLNIRTRKEMYWEHFGMMDDPVYAEHAFLKMMTYEENGFFPGDSVILTYETGKRPLNRKHVLQLIERYLR